ncbi:MAG: amidohydrolase family protein, partial [Candidatus Omnitrophica bacterium]|nr:amidohydrolase family protein [Candidatus Omnitrophota bacterium]
EDERYLPFWEFANERGAIILTHSWSPDPGKPTQELSTPNRFVPLLEKYPNVKLILGHAGGREVGFRMAIEAVNRCENCWVDISGDSFGYRHLEWLVEKMGPGKILYGTDSNWIEARYQYGHVLKSDLTSETKFKIFRENAVKLFGSHLPTCSTT